MYHRVYALLLIICFTDLANGQTQKFEIVRKFSQKDGLSSYNIRRIIQDKWGFIWIGTQDGLSRFDGNQFKNYSKSNQVSSRISGVDVRDMLEDTTKNQIWVLAAQTGIDIINTKTGLQEKMIIVPTEEKEHYNLSMLRCGDILWVGTSTGVSIFDFAKAKFLTSLPLPDNQTNKIDFSARSLHKDRYGNIWVCYSGYGIAIYQASTRRLLKTIYLTELSHRNNIKELRISSGVLLDETNFLFATSEGLRKIQYDSKYNISIDKSPVQKMKELNYENIDWVSSSAGNTILVSGYNKLFRFDHSLTSYQTLTEPSKAYESNWLNAVLIIYEDRYSNTWLGCQEGLGYIDREESPFQPHGYDVRSGTQLSHAFAVGALQNGNILVGLRDGLIEIDKQTNHYIALDKGHLYQHIFTDSKGFIHLSRPDGLFILNKGRPSRIDEVYSEFSPFRSISINSHLFINDTLTILGTETNKGILLWNPKKKSVTNLNNSGLLRLGSSIVNNIFKDQKNRIWVLSDHLVTIIAQDFKSKIDIKLRHPETGAPYKLFFDMCEKDGFYWLTSYGSGLLQVDQTLKVRREFNVENGLSNNGVYQVFPLSSRELLVTSNNGLSRINTISAKVNKYFVSDGLHSNAFEEASGTVHAGKIYVGGVNGITIISKSAFSTNATAPNLYITGVETSSGDRQTETNDISMHSVTIPSDAIQTIIRVVGLNFKNAARTTYAYRIAEEGNVWIDNKNSTAITFMSHLPGTFTLEVKATNEDGYSSNPVKLKLYFQPKWYQTWWFKLCVATLIALSLYRFYRFRIAQYEHEQKIRQRLARDLHDDLGSTINSINIYANLAILEHGALRYLTNIKQGTQDSVDGIRDIIWILDDKGDTFYQLGARIITFANPLCDVNGINFEMSIQDDLKEVKINKEEKRNLYLIIKEAINNSIKHACATSMRIAIINTGSDLSITIKDNGKGIAANKNTSGNGLINIKKRAEEIKFSLDIQSSEKTGTEIILRATQKS